MYTTAKTPTREADARARCAGDGVAVVLLRQERNLERGAPQLKHAVKHGRIKDLLPAVMAVKGCLLNRIMTFIKQHAQNT